MTEEINPEEFREYIKSKDLAISLLSGEIRFHYLEDNRTFSRSANQVYIRNPISNRLEQVTGIRRDYLIAEGRDDNGNSYSRQVYEKDVTSVFLPKTQQKSE